MSNQIMTSSTVASIAVVHRIPKTPVLGGGSVHTA